MKAMPNFGSSLRRTLCALAAFSALSAALAPGLPLAPGAHRRSSARRRVRSGGARASRRSWASRRAGLRGREPPRRRTLVGTQLVARSAPDGYNLVVGGLSNIALNMGLYGSPAYDSLADFTSAGLVVSHSYTLVARRDLPLASLAE